MAVLQINCSECQETINVAGEKDELGAKRDSALYEHVYTTNAEGTYIISLFVCPKCGATNTCQIDTQSTRKMLDRSKRLTIQGAQLRSEEKYQSIKNKEKQRHVDKKRTANNERLHLKRSELQAFANGLPFVRKDNGETIIFKLNMYKPSEDI